ncbi:hypothetical protein Bpfe_011405, partial [Biomphalaria pfeifferi]
MVQEGGSRRHEDTDSTVLAPRGGEGAGRRLRFTYPRFVTGFWHPPPSTHPPSVDDDTAM